MDKYCEHKKLYYSSKCEKYFFTWSIPNVSSVFNLNDSIENTIMLDGYNTYNANLCGSKDKISFIIGSSLQNLKCFVSMFIGPEALLSNSLNAHTSTGNYYNYDLISLPSSDESFQKLKQHVDESLVFICKIIKPVNSFSSVSLKKPANPTSDSLHNLKALAAALKNSSGSFSKEKIILRFGEEVEVVSKDLLCARSPVFAKMFENDMKEVKEKTVTITDIKMPVLKVLVCFLYTGKLKNSDYDFASNRDFDFDFLCDLYYVSDKYDIADLRQLCADLLLPKISMENINRALKLAFSHDDVRLKSTVLASIATNIETYVFTNDWKNLINDEPEVAAEVLNFFDF